MADISLRFNKDMLVLSAPLDTRLQNLGFDLEKDAALLAFLESEHVSELLRMEKLAGANCLVANTKACTPARLAHAGAEASAQEFVQASLSVARELSPQHVLAEIEPCGLPLDATSKASLNEHRNQYARAARNFSDAAFDAFFLNGFSDTESLKCALMGISQVYDKVVFASINVDEIGKLGCESARDGELVGASAQDGEFGAISEWDAELGCASTQESKLLEAFEVMSEYGAQVAGFSSGAPIEQVIHLAKRATQACSLPLLVQLRVFEHNVRQGEASAKNPYYCPDVMADAALRLHDAGVQFLRATGNATPAYTGALAASVTGLDVKICANTQDLSTSDTKDLGTAYAKGLGAEQVTDTADTKVVVAAQDTAAKSSTDSVHAFTHQQKSLENLVENARAQLKAALDSASKH